MAKFCMKPTQPVVYQMAKPKSMDWGSLLFSWEWWGESHNLAYPRTMHRCETQENDRSPPFQPADKAITHREEVTWESPRRRGGATRSYQTQVLADLQTSSNVGQVWHYLSSSEVDFLVFVQKLSYFRIFFGTFRNRGPEMWINSTLVKSNVEPKEITVLFCFSVFCPWKLNRPILLLFTHLAADLVLLHFV